MPVEFAPYQDHSARIAAWEKHYRAKGCNPGKARECAKKKRHKETWPPKDTPND